jgi:hypothetical protein
MWTVENRARYDRSRLRYPSDLTDEEWALACGLHWIERLMRIDTLRARAKRRGKSKDDGERSIIADNM